ncbi:Transcriptional regulator, ArsR family / Methyltransferase fusion [hydrothermal vent metagenome]|uniref:Transcriptional regulator, ArsR family / Methyltransferase fusion n=1 Tax=hydrothermal vent metagenome TaxID=652676 RepID=A0A3B0U1X2_9ZZZZ
MANFEKLVLALKAAGEHTRLRLLALLSEGELSVKDLTDILGQSQPRVSRHLKLLAEAGLVVRSAEGAWAYYRIADPGEKRDLVGALLVPVEKSGGILTDDKKKLTAIRREHQNQADEYFSKVAKNWDNLRNLHVPEEAVEAAILRVLGKKKVKRLLDLGSGTGRMLELLHQNYEYGTGIDLSREMIGVARAKLSASGINNAQVRLGDILSFDAGGQKEDLIILHQVLHYFDDPGQVLLKTAEILQRDGRILLVDFAPHELEYLRQNDAHRRLGLSKGQMEIWAKAAGMKIDVFERFENQKQQQGLVVCLWMLSLK